MAKDGAIRTLVERLTVAELARLVDLEVEDLVRLGLAASKNTPVPVVRRNGGEPAPFALSPDALVERLRNVAGLGGRQLDVARFLLLGETDRAIADHLGCSERTAKRAVADVLGRCGVTNRASLMLVIFRDAGTL